MTDDQYIPTALPIRAKRYDGSNAAEITAFVGSRVIERITYETDGSVIRQLTYQSTPTAGQIVTQYVDPDDYVIIEGTGPFTDHRRMPADQFERKYERVTR